MTVSLIDGSTYLPGEPISADYYAPFAESDDLRDNVMFRAPKFRHHVAEDETAIDMVERATAGLSNATARTPSPMSTCSLPTPRYPICPSTAAAAGSPIALA